MKKSNGAFVLLVLCLLVGAWTVTLNAQGAKTATVWPAAEIKWADMPSIKGAKIAVLWGNPSTGGYGALKSIPGGSVLAMHTHTQDQKVLAVAGTISLTIEGSAAKTLTPGSYAFIPGGVKHTATCNAGSDCTYFEEQQGASDIKFAEPPK